MGHDSWPKMTRRPRRAYDIALPYVSIRVCGCNSWGKLASTIWTFEAVMVGHQIQQIEGIYNNVSCVKLQIVGSCIPLGV